MRFKSHFILLAVTQSIFITGCSTVTKLNPFGDDQPQGTAPKYSNATEYQCNNGKHFYIRMMENGNSIWLIYPDREVSLNKSSASTGTLYSNGVAELVINGGDSTLNDGPQIAYTGCKAVMPAK